MRKAFTATQHCQVRVHCPACRTSAEWRQAVGAPEICPHGVTAEQIPPPVDTAAIARSRRAICDPCNQADCPAKRWTKCQRTARLSRPQFHCPAGKF